MVGGGKSENFKGRRGSESENSCVVRHIYYMQLKIYIIRISTCMCLARKIHIIVSGVDHLLVHPKCVVCICFIKFWFFYTWSSVSKSGSSVGCGAGSFSSRDLKDRFKHCVACLAFNLFSLSWFIVAMHHRKSCLITSMTRLIKG